MATGPKSGHLEVPEGLFHLTHYLAILRAHEHVFAFVVSNIK